MTPRGERGGFSRRRFLALGALAAAVTAAACSADEDDAGGPATTGPGRVGTGPGDGAAAAGDLDLAAFAAGLEILAVAAYTGALDVVATGRFGEAPVAGVEILAAARRHHEAHLVAWATRLNAGGRPKVTEPEAQLKPVVDAALGNAKGFAEVLALARTIEETAAATYLRAVPSLAGADVVALAASIQATDARHAAVLGFFLGEYPVPDVFAKTDRAAAP